MSKNTEPRMYCIVRCDLPEMTFSKLLAQIGHAWVCSLAECGKNDQDKMLDFMHHESQAKIVLRGKKLSDLEKAKAKADELGIPNALITDEGRTCFNEPTITVLGIGPTTIEEVAPVVKRLQVLTDNHIEKMMDTPRPKGNSIIC